MPTVTYKWCETCKDLMPTYRQKCRVCLLIAQKPKNDAKGEENKNAD